MFGRELSESEREIVSMPIQDGGLGLRFVSENADLSHETSTHITSPLVQSIISQSEDLPDPDEEKEARSTAISRVTEMKTIMQFSVTFSNMSQKFQRNFSFPVIFHFSVKFCDA